MDPDRYLQTFQPEDVIFAEGSEGRQFYIVIEGKVAIRKRTGETATTVKVMIPGDFFGELAVIDALPRSADAVALEANTKVMSVDRGRFLYLVSQQPAFAVMIMETLSNRLRGGTPAPSTTTATQQISRTKPADKAYTVIKVQDDVFQFRSRSRSANAYLFKGKRRNLLIDPGLGSSFGALVGCLNEVGLQPADIDTIILTHEHFDHVAAVPMFANRPLVAAHRLAANKIVNRDGFAIIQGGFAEPSCDFGIDLMLDEGAIINTGSHTLRVHHTPGHTSGCISLFEADRHILVSGDTVMSGGPMAGIFGSGNISDSIYSLELLAGLNAKHLLAGHGPLSDAPQADIAKTLVRSRALLSDSRLIFETLNGQDSINAIILAVRDLNR
jgi:hydroxyacylglutathione hydrolase